MRKSKDDLQKHTLHLNAGDYAKLQELHPEVGAAQIIRQLVRSYIKKIDPPVDLSAVKGDLDV